MLFRDESFGLQLDEGAWCKNKLLKLETAAQGQGIRCLWR
jgi:hypothetical protein